MMILDQFIGKDAKGNVVTFQLIKVDAQNYRVKRGNTFIGIHMTKEAAMDDFNSYKKDYEVEGGEENMGGLDKARATANKLKAEKEESEEKQLAEKEEAKNQLETLRENPTLAALYKKHAQVGAENLGGSIPYLRIHTANSLGNELLDGSRPEIGSFYYVPTKQGFKTITCHILTISKGFRIERTDEKTGEVRQQYNQIVAGVIVDDGKFKPFFMYVNGMKLRPVWDFGKEMGDLTRAGYPMFSVVVTMTTEEVKTEQYGYKWVPKFSIVRENGNPEIVLDVPTFNLLLSGVEKANQRITSIIQANEVQVAPVATEEPEDAEERIEEESPVGDAE